MTPVTIKIDVDHDDARYGDDADDDGNPFCPPSPRVLLAQV